MLTEEELMTPQLLAVASVEVKVLLNTDISIVIAIMHHAL
jgi:hypothetical protein